MWILRDLSRGLADVAALPIKILKGPRQSGKTSFLERLDTHRVVYLDDAAVRLRAEDDPRAFLDSFSSPIVLDEAALAPALFPELKRLLDSLDLDIIDRWIVAGHKPAGFRHRVLRVEEVWKALAELW